jgi:hypothetical protein
VPTVPAALGAGTICCAKIFQHPLRPGNLFLQKSLILLRFFAVGRVGIAQANRKVLDKPNI